MGEVWSFSSDIKRIDNSEMGCSFVGAVDRAAEVGAGGFRQSKAHRPQRVSTAATNSTLSRTPCAFFGAATTTYTLWQPTRGYVA